MQYIFQMEKMGIVAGTVDDKSVKGDLPKTPVILILTSIPF